MTTFKLTRLNEPNFDELYEMKSALKDFLDEKADSANSEWMEHLNTILDFQDSDGSFKLFSTYEIPSDARVDFCHEPTYICSSILMKAYLTGDSKLKEKIETPLIHGSHESILNRRFQIKRKDRNSSNPWIRKMLLQKLNWPWIRFTSRANRSIEHLHERWTSRIH